ncbi:MAG: hypothetical protein A2309_12250 [Bacteroidetes bacterium RIFOXYB2_FULL_35_7]|nr:MAG: hypothetical protein A2309_12250 [Bacteroidetes bacterium RIFOXYB2_FULL_35_7]
MEETTACVADIMKNKHKKKTAITEPFPELEVAEQRRSIERGKVWRFFMFVNIAKAINRLFPGQGYRIVIRNSV